MKKNNKFRLIFKHQQNLETVEVEYELHDSVVAQKWFKKIKHLANVPVDLVETELVDLNDLRKIYHDFCAFANLTPIAIDVLDQDTLNRLHKIYEDTHDDLSRRKNNSILYQFHHSIHWHDDTPKRNNINVSWGVKEGPLTEKFDCNNYYADRIEKNNIYLPWAELGKTPLTYWRDKEPSDQTRFNQLAKPHVYFRAKFFVSRMDVDTTALPTQFTQWFEQYKNDWFTHHGISKWDEVDEQSAPLLAITNNKVDLSNFRFQSIII